MSSLWVRRGPPGEVPGPPPPVAEVLAEGPVWQQQVQHHVPQRGSASSSDVSDKSLVSARDVVVKQCKFAGGLPPSEVAGVVYGTSPV